MIAALGNSKEYTLKQYLLFAEKLRSKSKVSFFSFSYKRCSIGYFYDFSGSNMQLDVTSTNAGKYTTLRVND